MRVNQLEDYREEATKERAQDRQKLGSLEETTESLEANIDDLTEAEEIPTSPGGCEHTKRTQEETEGANYSVVLTGGRRTPTRVVPPHEIHTVLPVKHGGTNRLVTVECVYFCEMERVALMIPLYYNVITDRSISRRRPLSEIPEHMAMKTTLAN